ncbi:MULTISPECIES: hypothetical protein [unclassified Roseitalea]|uniref:hypothetical protein n=1 Tax=unclassified Roseitalea TaxID=2639107 RepID=UPI00273F9173|nr:MULTISPECIES: hypothetical protein [unclassified Roseitalea]
MNLDYAFHHMECALAVMIGRREALTRMDISADGFWRSFGAILVSAPALFFVWVLSARQTQAEFPLASTGGLILAEAAFELFVWLAPVFVLAMILRPLGFGDRFSHLIIARNWSAAVISYAIAVPFVAQLFAGPESGLAAMLLLVVLAVVFIAAVRVTRTALDSSLMVAIAFTATELFIGLMLASAYYGAVLP